MQNKETTNVNIIRGWLIVGVSFLILMILFATAINCMGIYVKPVSEHFGIDRTTYMLTITINSLTMLLSAIVAGRMMEKFNVKTLMVAGVIAAGLAMFIYAFAPSIWFFYIAAAITGITLSFTCNIPIAILIKNWFPVELVGFAMGIALVGTGAGSMILNPLYTWIIEGYGWRYSFGTAGVLLLGLILPLVLLIVREKPEHAFRIDDPSERSSEEVHETSKTGLMLGEALRRPITWIMFLGFVIVALVNMVFVSQGVAYLTDCGFDPAKAAAVIAGSSGVLIVGKVLIGYLDGRIGTKKAALFSLCMVLLALGSFYMIGVTGSVITAILYAVCYGLGAPVATVSMPMIVTKMYGNRDYGSIFGFFCMTAGVGGMLQSVVSMVYDKTGSYGPAWIGLGVVTVIAIIIYAVCIHPVEPKTTPQSTAPENNREYASI